MSVEAIGSVLESTATTSPNAAFNEQDFIKLFVNQLQYQDPMQPLDNSQFLAQLSQFVGIQQQAEQVQGIDNLLSLSSVDQSLGLLNHTVDVLGTDGTTHSTGKVTAISYSASGAQLTVTSSASSVLTNVGLSQVRLVTP
jgi:flagellar basal-body rod modification protein FlgD